MQISSRVEQTFCNSISLMGTWRRLFDFLTQGLFNSFHSSTQLIISDLYHLHYRFHWRCFVLISHTIHWQQPDEVHRHIMLYSQPQLSASHRITSGSSSTPPLARLATIITGERKRRIKFEHFLRNGNWFFFSWLIIIIVVSMTMEFHFNMEMISIQQRLDCRLTSRQSWKFHSKKRFRGANCKELFELDELLIECLRQRWTW